MEYDNESFWVSLSSVFSSHRQGGHFSITPNHTTWDDYALIEKAVSTVGFINININYARKTKGLDDGEYLYVEWYDGIKWNLLEETQSTSWSLQNLTCEAGANGNAAFKVRFSTNAGNSSECGYVDDVEITGTPSGPIDNPPLITITNPSEGDTVFGNVTVSADATDDEGVTQVEFIVDGVSIGIDSDDSDGWSANWITTSWSDGSYIVSAIATDTAPQTASDSISVTVNNVDDVPTVSIVNPTDGATVSGTIAVLIDAADTEDEAGTLTVEWNIDGGVWQSATYNGSSGYYETSWDTTTATDGNHTVNARATDSVSNVSSTSNTVTVDNTGPSTVSVQSIDMSLVSAGKNLKAVAGVTVSPAVSGATVIGNWDLDGKIIQIGATGVTDGSGYTELTSPPKKAKSGETFTFMVTGVELSGYDYDSGQGITEGSITVE
jgi:hypothetical protein